MKGRTTRVLTLLALLLWASGGIKQAAGTGWPEAVSRLAEERTHAENCVALLKGYGNQAQISQGQLSYGTTKADFDGVIAGLLTALAEGGNPDSLPSLNIKLERGASGLSDLCKVVAALVPGTSGQKGLVDRILAAMTEPMVLKALVDAVATLYNNHRKDDALTRQTIRTQLEAAQWPDFTEIQAAQ